MVILDGVEVLDVREAAAYVQRTPETVRRWVWSGRVAARRQGNRLFIARAELDAVRAAAAPATPVSLHQWAAGVPRRAQRAGESAAALVSEDRRSDDHGR